MSHVLPPANWKAFVFACLALGLLLLAPTQAQRPNQPQASRTRILFQGVTHFNEAQLRSAIAEQLQTISQEGLSPATADDTAFFVGVFYRKAGYSHVDVTWTIASNRQLIITVREGPLTTLEEIRFEGNSSISSDLLRDYVIGPTRERFSALQQKLPFVESDIKTGVEHLRGFYFSEGFLDAFVSAPEIAFSNDNTRATVLVRIKEGKRYRFGKISFGGDLVFMPPTQLLKEIEPFSSKPYTPNNLANMQRAVVYFYKSRGYYDAQVEVQSAPEEATGPDVPVHFTITSGEIYRFDGITATGLDRLSERFLPARFGKLRGTLYNPAKLDEIFRELMRTGLFTSLRINSVPLPTHEIALQVEVKEAKARELGFSLGYGSFDGIIVGFHAADRNLFGTGRPLSMSLEASQRSLSGELLYLDPWFLESDFALRLRLYALNQEFNGYSKFETGLRSELSRKLTKNFEASVFLLGRQLEIHNEGIDPTQIGETSYPSATLGLTQTADFRNSTVNPDRGWVLNTTEDFSFHPPVEFLRGTFRLSYYLPLRRSLLAFGARGGVLMPLSGSQVPIDERFFNGGSRSVRSFAERELGPKDINGFPIGGETFSTFNAEYVFPIWGNLDGSFFTDAGSVSRFVGRWPGTLRYGVGAGLRYRLPIGPVRIDYGLNPNPKPDEAQGALHLSFGFAF